MHGNVRPGPMLASCEWNPLAAPTWIVRSGEFWNGDPTLSAEGHALFPIEVPDGTAVLPFVSSAADGGHAAAYYDAADRSVHVLGWTEDPYANSNFDFVLRVELFHDLQP